MKVVPLTSRLEFHSMTAPPSLPALPVSALSSSVRLELSYAYSAPAAAHPPDRPQSPGRTACIQGPQAGFQAAAPPPSFTGCANAQVLTRSYNKEQAVAPRTARVVVV